VLNSFAFRVFILYCDLSHRPTLIFSSGRFIRVNCSFFIERCHSSLYLFLLRYASLFRNGGVYSLQSVREAQSEAASYRTEKGNSRTGLGCWLWPDGRKRTDLHLSGNVQPHAGTAERMCITSPSNIRVIKISTPCFAIFALSNNYVLFRVSSKKVWISDPTRKHNVMQIIFQ